LEAAGEQEAQQRAPRRPRVSCRGEAVARGAERGQQPG
jgi:hypothetical protein